jgi:hypothetical protein
MHASIFGHVQIVHDLAAVGAVVSRNFCVPEEFIGNEIERRIERKRATSAPSGTIPPQRRRAKTLIKTPPCR